jgi:hypothetical protein
MSFRDFLVSIGVYVPGNPQNKEKGYEQWAKVCGWDKPATTKAEKDRRVQHVLFLLRLMSYKEYGGTMTLVVPVENYYAAQDTWIKLYGLIQKQAVANGYRWRWLRGGQGEVATLEIYPKK